MIIGCTIIREGVRFFFFWISVRCTFIRGCTIIRYAIVHVPGLVNFEAWNTTMGETFVLNSHWQLWKITSICPLSVNSTNISFTVLKKEGTKRKRIGRHVAVAHNCCWNKSINLERKKVCFSEHCALQYKNQYIFFQLVLRSFLIK